MCFLRICSCLSSDGTDQSCWRYLISHRFPEFQFVNSSHVHPEHSFCPYLLMSLVNGTFQTYERIFSFFFSESSCHLLSTLNQDASTGTLHPLKLSIQPAAVLHQCFISSLVFRTFFKSFVNLCILWILHIVTGDLRILLVGTYNCLATNDDTLQIAALPWKDDWEWQSQCSAELWREYSSFIHEWEDK